MTPVRFAALVTGLLVLSGGAIAIADRDDDRRDKRKARHAKAVLEDGAGNRVGKVLFKRQGRGVSVSVRAKGLPPGGFHGFHIHASGRCEAPDFKSATGHLSRGGQSHGAHVGDMPVLLVGSDGRASARFRTDRFTISDLRDDDGSAVIVHAKPDNYANIPDRYDPDPDEETRSTGDAGSRLACGVIR